MTLTKRDLVVRISEETGLIQTQVFDVVQKTLDYIAEALAKGDKVELRNFGVFDVKIRKARVGRNPEQAGDRRADSRPRHGEIQGRQGNARRSPEADAGSKIGDHSWTRLDTDFTGWKTCFYPC